MPAKNTIKLYIEGGYYHIYNRGVEKRNIFQDEQDYKVFLNYLKSYLSPQPKPEKVSKTFTLQGTTFEGVPRQPNNYHNQIILIAYCLMPNHFHLLLQQKSNHTIKKFMQSLGTRYSVYFNKKYKRVGGLFQGIYKAVNVQDDAYLLHLSRYIHLNPSEYTTDLTKTYSSYCDYLGLRHTPWVNPTVVLSFFNQATLPFLNKVNSYKSFVEEYAQDDKEILDNLVLDEDL